MKVLYSNMLPLGIQDNQETIDDSIRQQIAKSDKVDIAVGYVSLASLEELDRLVCENKIKQIVLVIGMYYIEGMPERTYHTAVRLNKKWQVKFVLFALSNIMVRFTASIRIIRLFPLLLALQT